MKIRYLTFSTSWVELSAGSLHTVPLDQVLIVEVGIQFVFSLIFFTDWPSWSCHRRSSLFRWSIDEAAKKDDMLWETFVDIGIYIYIWKQWQVYKGDIMLHEKIWHSLRCCRIWGAPVPAKFWRLTGWKNFAPRNFKLTLRCIAFRIYKACYRRKSTVLPGKFLLSKNNP